MPRLTPNRLGPFPSSASRTATPAVLISWRVDLMAWRNDSCEQALRV